MNYGSGCVEQVGAFEALVLAEVEAPVKYHSSGLVVLTMSLISGRRTVSGGQFNWGGCLLKSNGGVQRFPQRV